MQPSLQRLLSQGTPPDILTGNERRKNQEHYCRSQRSRHFIYGFGRRGTSAPDGHYFVPVVSLEGYEEDTDGRRGQGVYERLLEIVKKIKNRGIFWSVSLTVTRSNFDSVTDKHFVKTLIDLGCKLFFFLEYTPIQEGTEDWLPTKEQLSKLIKIRNFFRSNHKALFIAIPGDEEEIGGCLSAGRGFVHVSPSGNVEPCPFAPFSDANVRDMSLKDALKSEFLKSIRQGRDHLSEAGGGCVLWVEREWVRSMLHNLKSSENPAGSIRGAND
jgi:MoaA/NifB/PqqE/SkfB family radical SAM enzyme